MELKSVMVSIISVTIGILLITYMLVPIVADCLPILNEINTTWGTLVSVVVLASIIGLVWVAINGYMSKGGKE